MYEGEFSVENMRKAGLNPTCVYALIDKKHSLFLFDEQGKEVASINAVVLHNDVVWRNVENRMQKESLAQFWNQNKSKKLLFKSENGELRYVINPALPLHDGQNSRLVYAPERPFLQEQVYNWMTKQDAENVNAHAQKKDPKKFVNNKSQYEKALSFIFPFSEDLHRQESQRLLDLYKLSCERTQKAEEVWNEQFWHQNEQQQVHSLFHEGNHQVPQRLI